ncbi:MAG TPA: hypothetical protein VND44_03740 [Acidimicrobiales bacterium]|nr:hypothetical protein [Acidimicrobiales bacterium]
MASVALVGASIAGFASVYSAADRKTPAVVLIRAVGQGQRISSADIGEAEVAVSPGVDFIPLSQVSIVAGKRAVAAMPAGSLVTPADLTGAPAIAGGDAVVGVALKDGTYPASGLSPGDRVLVVQTAAPGMSVAAPPGDTSAAPPGDTSAASSGVASAASSGVASVPPLAGGPTTAVSGVAVGGVSGGDTGILVPQASVFAVTVPGTSSSGGATLLVSLEVPSAVAAQVATASAAGQVGLVLLPRGPGSGAPGSPSGVTP